MSTVPAAAHVKVEALGALFFLEDLVIPANDLVLRSCDLVVAIRGCLDQLDFVLSRLLTLVHVAQ